VLCHRILLLGGKEESGRGLLGDWEDFGSVGRGCIRSSALPAAKGYVAIGSSSCY
jgi:hypothetical protein